MSIDGKWRITVNTPMGPQESTVDFKSSDDASEVTGTQSMRHGDLAVYDGRVNGDKVAWKIDVTMPFSMTLAFDGIIDGDSISGQSKAGRFPHTTFTGHRL